jgi:hypothetical protein
MLENADVKPGRDFPFPLPKNLDVVSLCRTFLFDQKEHRWKPVREMFSPFKGHANAGIQRCANKKTCQQG